MALVKQLVARVNVVYVSMKKMRRKFGFQDILRKYWFLFGILLCIVLAELFPGIGIRGGPLKPEITVKYGAVALIFMLSGLTLNISDVKKTAFQTNLHMFIQAFTFLFVPLCIYSLNYILSAFGVNQWILKGLGTMSVMPPPVSTAVILTKSVGGNEAAAIFNSALGSFLGVIVTPILLFMFLESSTVVPFGQTFIQLTITVVLPLLFGQLVQGLGLLKASDIPTGLIGQSCLLLIIFTTFCEAFFENEATLHPLDILLTVLLVVLVHMALMYISWTLSKRIGSFSPSDQVAIIFCCSHKSLTLGIPIIRILFAGYSHFSQISLPLLIYHPAQIILGSLVATELNSWLSLKTQRIRIAP